MARLGARSVVCPWGFREFGLGGEERGGGGGGAAWSDVVARLLACRRRYVDDGLVRPSVALVDLGVGRGLYNDASPQVPVPSSWTFVTGSPLTHVMQLSGSVGFTL